MRLTRPVCLAVAVVLAAAGAAAGEPAAQRAFLATWQRAAERPDEAAEQWRGFAEAHPDDDLGRLATLLQGSALLREDTTDERLEQAMRCFRFEQPKQEPDSRPGRALGRRTHRAPATQKEDPEPASDLRRQIEEAGQGGAARVGMIRLDRQLRTYYRRHVEYPATLEELVHAGLAQRADLIDPFGQPYAYEATLRKLMPKVPRQAYTLACTTTGATRRQLKAALRDAFESNRQVMISTLSLDPASVFVRPTRKDGAFGAVRNWPVGEAHNGLTLWAICDGFIIIGENDRPSIVVAQPKDADGDKPSRRTNSRRRLRSPTDILRP